MKTSAVVDISRKMQGKSVDKPRTLQGSMVLVLLALGGCAGTPPVEVQKINIAVPVPCQVAEPERPVMPTEALAPGVPPFVLLRASLAEIDRREAYEGQLVAALASCRAPIK